DYKVTGVQTCALPISLVALMLLDGLRSCEVLDLRLEDLNPSQAQMLVLGKGNKKRLLPLPQEAIQALQNYLRIERPLTNSPLAVDRKSVVYGKSVDLE